MTEDEWRASGDPRVMLTFLRDRASGRKLRLFACAGCLTLDHALPDEAVALLDVCERYADGRAGVADLAAGRAAAKAPQPTPGGLPGLRDTGAHLAVRAAVLAAWVNVDGWRGAAEATLQVVAARRHTGHKQAPLELAGLLRDVAGPLPFRAMAADPAWLTPTVVGLAGAIYADRAFDRLPVLADALEEAGCDSEDVLTHCRSDGPHVRGCWVVDLILGKE